VKKNIPIKVLTRLSKFSEDSHMSIIVRIPFKEHLEAHSLEMHGKRLYEVTHINKHDASLDKMFDRPLDQLESLSIR
jgi:hypothetical protein